MYGTVIRIFLALILSAAVGFPANVFAKSAKRLVTLNGIEYTDADFRDWWKHWNDKKEPMVPDSPEEFIKFQLMAQQGKEMGYDTHPAFLRKVQVFLKVQAMMYLKYEEVDSKATVTDDEVKKYYDENYGTLWSLQILSFDAEEKARKAYQLMLPYDGQMAGQLVFADFYGGAAEEKAETLDDVNVTVADFSKNNIESWLPIVRSLKPDQVAEPFFREANGKYVLLRLKGVKPNDPAVFEKEKESIKSKVNKEKRNRLTNELTEKLKDKYKVKVDRELFDSIKLDVEYPKEFLDQELVTMTDFTATVGDLIYNAVKEKGIRKSLSDAEIKSFILDTLISQVLIDKESLARGYEKRPPLMATYEFYRQNRLRIELENSLLASVDISDQELQDYYTANLASFSVPEKIVFTIIQGPDEVMQKIWFGVLQGQELPELAKKYSLEPHTQSQGIDSLAPIVVEQLNKLKKGEVSSPFGLDGGSAVVKLINRIPGQVDPLAQVKGKVVEQLRKEKFQTMKAEYISKLMDRSQIEVDEKVWQSLVRELANEK